MLTNTGAPSSVCSRPVGGGVVKSCKDVRYMEHQLPASAEKRKKD